MVHCSFFSKLLGIFPLLALLQISCRGIAPSPPGHLKTEIPLPVAQIEIAVADTQGIDYYLELLLPTGPAGVIGIQVDSTLLTTITDVIEQMTQSPFVYWRVIPEQRVELGKSMQGRFPSIKQKDVYPVRRGTVGIGISRSSAPLVLWLAEGAETAGYQVIGTIVSGIELMELFEQYASQEQSNTSAWKINLRRAR